MITRDLAIPSVNASVRRERATTSRAGNDMLHGDFAGSTGAAAGEYDDVIFGDYGVVTQDIATPSSARRRHRRRLRPAGLAAGADR